MADLPEQIRRWAQQAADGARDPVTLGEVQRGTSSLIPEKRGLYERRLALVAAVVVVLAAGAAAVALLREAPDDRTSLASAGSTNSDGGSSAMAAMGSAAVRVRLEPIDGHFEEGFEVGLRFETGGGEVIASMLWTDAVMADQIDDEPGIDDFYDYELVQAVPAGSVVVRGEVSIGAGPGPVPPDLEGDLRCSIPLELADGDEATVEVTFDGVDECLHRVDDPAGDPVDADIDDQTPMPTTTVNGVPTSSTSDATVTSEPGRDDLVAGSNWYVDVDLVCEGFELGGWWVLDGGDVSGWQPEGERHEGGTFTIDGPDTGTFRGDAAGTKVASFRRLPAEEQPTCEPIPR